MIPIMAIPNKLSAANRHGSCDLKRSSGTAACSSVLLATSSLGVAVITARGVELTPAIEANVTARDM
jgi:hypothetical protein